MSQNLAQNPQAQQDATQAQTIQTQNLAKEDNSKVSPSSAEGDKGGGYDLPTNPTTQCQIDKTQS